MFNSNKVCQIASHFGPNVSKGLRTQWQTYCSFQFAGIWRERPALNVVILRCWGIKMHFEGAKCPLCSIPLFKHKTLIRYNGLSTSRLKRLSRRWIDILSQMMCNSLLDHHHTDTAKSWHPYPLTIFRRLLIASIQAFRTFA